jgi:hypothetical protein
MSDIIELNVPTDGQVSAIWRAVRVADDRSVPVPQRMDAVVLIEDILLSCVTDQSTVPDIKQKLATGKLDLREDLIGPAIAKFAGGAEAAPTTGPVKAVRRGRPRKSVS